MAATAATTPAEAGAPAEVPTTDGHVPVIDLNALLNLKEGDAGSQAAYDAECKKVAEALHEYSILIVRDPRVTEEDNNGFLDLLEAYFESPEEDRQKDVRKELSYQVGATPSMTELPKNHCERMKAYKHADTPLSLCPPERDVKWRFFWRVGERPSDTKFAELNAEPVVPAGFPTWKETMDGWGAKLLAAGQDVAKMAAAGFGLPPDAFTSRMQAGPHLLAPTASDFNKFSAPGTVLAGFHYDLNFMTVHGKSRFPGLFIWTRSGKKLRVVVPDGCLLMQAGKQMEFLTGGHVKAGFHEVVVVPQTSAAITAAKEAGRSLWRISSTCFTHIASDVTLTPLGDFATPAACEEYPATSTGDQVNAELASINLGAGSSGPDE